MLIKRGNGPNATGGSIATWLASVTFGGADL